MDSINNLDKLITEFKSEGYENEWIEMYLIKNFKQFNKDHIIESIARVSQIEFRKQIVERDKVCLISGFDSIECEAAHIIPYSECKSYAKSNGILLNACLHKLFDLYMFSINPLTLNVEVKSEITSLSICKFAGKVIAIPKECIDSLKRHYEKFINTSITS